MVVKKTKKKVTKPKKSSLVRTKKNSVGGVDFKKKIGELLVKWGVDEGMMSLEVPPDPKLGNYAFPCFGLAKTMKKYDVVFEVNTNGRNRPLADFYPDRRFLRIFREEEVPVCVNSDAHMPSRVGQYFDEAYELLRYVGFTEMAIFDKRVRKMIPF